MDSLLLTLLDTPPLGIKDEYFPVISSTKEVIEAHKRNFPSTFKEGQRREFFHRYLIDNEWLEVFPTTKLELILDTWEQYIESPKENMTNYHRIKVMLQNHFPKLPEDLLYYTTILHRTEYLQKNGLTDNADLNRYPLEDDNSGGDTEIIY